MPTLLRLPRAHLPQHSAVEAANAAGIIYYLPYYLAHGLFRPYASALRMEWGLSDAKYNRFGQLFKSIASTLSPGAQAVVQLFAGSSGSKRSS